MSSYKNVSLYASELRFSIENLWSNRNNLPYPWTMTEAKQTMINYIRAYGQMQFINDYPHIWKWVQKL